jgi:septal ring factor EnvC (AmiA/AmiB activator)
VIFALDPAVAGLLAAVPLLVSAITATWVAVTRRKADVQTLIISGFEKLNVANVDRIEMLEQEVADLTNEMRHARAESRRANQHAYECERELRTANKRIAQLEGAAE